jgi:hypothetical protein
MISSLHRIIEHDQVSAMPIRSSADEDGQGSMS